MKVLIIDDEPIVLKALGYQLRVLGHDVMTAQLVEEALDMIGVEEFDVLLCDHHLGGVTSGLELITMLRERESSLRHVLMSGDSRARHPAEAAGVDFVEKPFSREDLQRVLG